MEFAMQFIQSQKKLETNLFVSYNLEKTFNAKKKERSWRSEQQARSKLN